jgi:hypothetical protein
VYLISGLGDNSTGRQPTTDSLTTNRSVNIGVIRGSFQEVFEFDAIPIDRPSTFEILSL